jgi:Transposase DDE domain
MYIPLTSSSTLIFSLPSVLYTIADLGYDAKKLYEYSKKTLRIDLVCPVKRYKSTSKKRLELVCFFQSILGQAIYNRRRISVEPLIEHIKSVFRIDPLPALGFHKVSAIVLLSVLLYQIMVYYNCKTEKAHTKSIKYMLGTW